MKILIFLSWLFSATIVAFAQQKPVASVCFNSGKHQLDVSACRVLDSLVVLCRDSGVIIVGISGFCDSVGSTGYNQVLSENRANEVQSYLSLKGIDLKGASIEGKNETQQFAGDQFYRNRRVDIFLNKPPVKMVSALEEKISQAEEGDLIRLENITFYNNSSRPLPESMPVFEELYQIMLSQPTLQIAIEGHICCIHYDDTNLSGERAQVVYDYLLNKGIDPGRMSYQGFGHTRPLNEERTEAEKQMNRRVEIRVVKK